MSGPSSGKELSHKGRKQQEIANFGCNYARSLPATPFEDSREARLAGEAFNLLSLSASQTQDVRGGLRTATGKWREAKAAKQGAVLSTQRDRTGFCRPEGERK